MTAIDSTPRFALGDGAAKGPDDPGREIRIGAMIAGVFFLGLLGWAALVPLDAGAYAQGVIAVSGNRQAVQTRDGGVVTRLAVQEGQLVEKGQVLVEISAGELRATERGLTSEVLTILAQRERLLAERSGQTSFAQPVEFASLDPDDRVLADRAMDLQRREFLARRQALDTQRGVFQQRSAQLGEQIKGYEQQVASNVEQRRLISDELTGVKSLAERGFAPLTRVRELERTQAALSGSEGSYRAEISRAGEAIGEARLQIVAIERQRMEEIATTLRDLQVRLGDIQPRLYAAREQLERALVKAPASGKVVGLSVFTVGGVASPGQLLMEIVPQDKDLVIQAQINPDDGDDLRVGQTTQVRFTALHERNLPLLEGRLTKLSADSFVDEKSGLRYFRAEIEVPESELAKIAAVRGPQTGLQAGLPVEVLVPLRKRSALTYLTEPLFETFWRTGREH